MPSLLNLLTRAAAGSGSTPPASSLRTRGTSVKSAATAVPDLVAGRHVDVAKPRLPIFSNLAAYADVESRIRQLESATGRAAMIGTGVAIATEIFTDHGLFDNLRYIDVAEFCSLAGMLCLAAGGIAAKARDPIGINLRRAVNRSLISFSHAPETDSEAKIMDSLIDDLVCADLLQYIIELDNPAEDN